MISYKYKYWLFSHWNQIISIILLNKKVLIIKKIYILRIRMKIKLF